MNKTIEKKLLHFYTDGSIYEDFSESRAKKTAKLRRIIRACFYTHCAAAIICIVLAVVLHAGIGTIVISVCEVVLVGLAFLAVGDMTLMKTLLCCGDMVFAAAMFVTGIVNGNKAPFFIAGAVSAVSALIALCAFFAALCKIFLEEFSPLSLRREHYTLLPNFSSDAADDIPDMPDEPMIVLPPPRSEYQVLADKLKEILCAPKEEKREPEKTEAEPAAEQTAANVQPQTEVTE